MIETASPELHRKRPVHVPIYCGIGRRGAAIAFALAACVAAAPAEAACHGAPLSTEPLRVLDRLVDTDPTAAIATARAELAVTPPTDAYLRAQLYLIVAEAEGTLDNDPVASGAAGDARKELAQVPAGAAVAAIRFRLSLVEASGLQTQDELEAGGAMLRGLEAEVPARSIEHACLLVTLGRLEGRLTHQDISAKAAVAGYQLARELGAHDVVADAAYELAITYRRAGLYADALRMVSEAVDASRASGRRPALANALWEQARILGDQGDYVTALPILSESTELTKALRDPTGLAFDDLERCNELIGLHRIEEAELACRAADKAFLSLHREDQSSITQFYSARIDLARGRYQAALERLDRALESNGRHAPPRILGGLYNERAEALARLGRPAEALSDLRRSIGAGGRDIQLQRSLAAAASNAQMQIERIDLEKRELERRVSLEKELGRNRAVVTRLSIGVASALLALSIMLIALLWNRVRHQRAMGRANEILETRARVIDSVREGVLLVDARGLVEYANPSACRLLGRAGEGLIGASLATIGVGNSAHPSSTNPAVGSPAEARREVHVRSEAGVDRAVLVTESTLELATRQVRILVLLDITDERRLEREVLQAASAERDRLSKEVHEGLGQELTGIAFLLKSVASADGNASSAVDNIVRHVNSAISSARMLAQRLAPVHLGGGALDSALEYFARELARNGPIRVSCEASLGGLRLTVAEADHLYRIAQEAVTNAMRHSGCSGIDIELGVARGYLLLAILDDGSGIPDSNRSAGLGLSTIEYRARLLRGTMQIERPASGGTRIVVRVPVAQFEGGG